MISTTKAPRPWAEMLDAWIALLSSLLTTIGDPGGRWRIWFGPMLIDARESERGQQAPAGMSLHAQAWRWMWSLPPCSEARKAAFTLGHAALMIERWRGLQEIGEALAPLPDDAAIGQRGEALLRIAAWHIDDARGEAHARTLGHEPTIPPHERVYGAGQPLDPDHGGINFVTLAGRDRGDVATRILDDHFATRANVGRKLLGDAGAKAFAELAIASLPDGPWAITTVDVERFLELILEDAGPC